MSQDRPTRFSPPRVHGERPRTVEAFSKQVEGHLNSPYWLSGVIPLHSWPSAPPTTTQTEPQTEEGAGVAAVQVPTLGAPQPNNVLPAGVIIRTIDVPHTLLKVVLTTARPTEGSSSNNHLQVRLRDWANETWLAGVWSSLDYEFGPVPIERDIQEDVEIPAGATLGGIGIIEGAGPEISGARTVSVDILVVRLMSTPILFLDIDGTVRQGKKDLGRRVNCPEDVEIYPGVPERLVRWRAAGYRIVGVSNQVGIRLGHTTADLVQQGMARTQHLCANIFDSMQWWASACPAMAKPGIGMFYLGIKEALDGQPFDAGGSYMVGDNKTDQEAARRMGVRFIWADDWRSRGEP